MSHTFIFVLLPKSSSRYLLSSFILNKPYMLYTIKNYFVINISVNATQISAIRVDTVFTLDIVNPLPVTSRKTSFVMSNLP